MPTINLLSEADQALGELNGVGRMLPNPHLLIGPFLRREAVSSSRIEGTITSLEQLFLFEVEPTEDEQTPDRYEVSNYVGTLQYGLKRLDSLPVSLRLMRELHERLMRGVRGQDRNPGEFRDQQNMIGREGQTPTEARFVPPPVNEMKQALGELEKYIAYERRLPVLIQLALIHYQFETIHPFLDGNGRIGRLLISLLLCERRLLSQPLLYLSAYFEEHKQEYVDNLLAVSQRGDWAGWIDFFLRAMAVQSRTAIRRCNQLLDLRDKYRNDLKDVTNSQYLYRLIDLIFERPAISITGAAVQLGVTFRAAQKHVETLEEANILWEATGLARNRVYLATAIVRILDSPDSPIPD